MNQMSDGAYLLAGEGLGMPEWRIYRDPAPADYDVLVDVEDDVLADW